MFSCLTDVGHWAGWPPHVYLSGHGAACVWSVIMSLTSSVKRIEAWVWCGGGLVTGHGPALPGYLMSVQIWVSQTCSHSGYQVKISEKLMFYMIEFRCPTVRIQKESWYINKSHVHRKLTLDWIFANSNCPICQLIYLFMQNFSLINMQFDFNKNPNIFLLLQCLRFIP